MGLPIKLKLPEGFLDEEIRCGYTVPSKVKRIWAVELDLLSELMRVCQKHDIKMQISYGTLLGAVRHKGFIPWDDDLDVWLPRKEFTKLLSIADSEFQHPYFFQTALTDRKYYLPYARLRNSLTTGAVTGQEGVDYNNGIYIDIYVLDGFVRSKFLYYAQLALRRLVLKAVVVYNQAPCHESKSVRIFLSRLIRPIARIFSYKMWVLLNYWTTSLYNRIADRYSVVYEMMNKPYKDWVAKTDLGDTIFLDFECLHVPAPRNYDAILRREYGEYMKYPSIDKIGKWHEGKIKFDPDVPFVELFGRKAV